MADLVSELNSLDFGVYIGGPLQAAVNAQNSASLAQVNFIKSVGFTPLKPEPEPEPDPNADPNANTNDTDEDTTPVSHELGDLVYANFVISNSGADGTTSRTIQVPFLTMLNIPSIRIEEITIDFNAKLTSVETEDTSATLGVGGTLSAGCKFASLKVSAAYKKTTNKGSNVEKTYSMSVHVSAVNDELPAGLEKILSLLEEEIKSPKE